MNELDFLDKLIKAAERGGGLSTSAVLFLGNIIQVAFIVWLLKINHKAELVRNTTNEKSIEARLAMAQALGKLAEKTEETSDRIERVELILDERLARRI